MKTRMARNHAPTNHHGCARHPTEPGVGTCARCGYTICEGCRVPAAGKTFCSPCAMRAAGVTYRGR